MEAHIVSSQGIRKQNGVVMVVALIVLVVMTLAGLALIRSVDTANIIAGNLAFHQAATHSGDVGVETAVTWINNCNSSLNGCNPAWLYNDDPTNGYSASGSTNNPGTLANPNETWSAYWARALANRAKTLNPDAAGNTVSYVIDRLCALPGSPSGGANCTISPVTNIASGNAEEAGQVNLTASSVVYYRITAQITGPRSTVSYVQAIVAQ
jgi:type IV pilus assembly protein PilX